MAIFSRYPYTDFHRLNADWILDQVKAASAAAAQAAEDAETAANTVESYETRLAAVESGLDGAVRFDLEQQLSGTEQTRARANISAAPSIGVVMYNTAQLLDDTYKAQARSNIGAASVAVEATAAGAVQFATSQSLTSTQKQQARTNIRAASTDDVTEVISSLQSLAAIAVRVNGAQSFTDAQKLQARQNIGAASADAVPSGVVMYSTAQSLTNGEKSQARANINARDADNDQFERIELLSGDTMDVDITVEDSATVPVLVLDGIDGQGSGNPVKISGVATPTAGSDAANKTYADSIRGMYLSTIAGSDVVIQPDAVNAVPNTLYVCSSSELNSLEIVPAPSYAANREFTVRFTSGGTPTELTSTLDIRGLDDLIPDSNMIYEINVLGNLAVWHSWAAEVVVPT